MVYLSLTEVTPTKKRTSLTVHALRIWNTAKFKEQNRTELKLKVNFCVQV